MMASRRRRKRYHQAAPPPTSGRRGDRPSAPVRGAGGTLLLFDWSGASHDDLALLRRAIDADWPVPYPKTAALMEATGAVLQNAGTARDARRRLAAVRVFLAADRVNLREAGRG
jgi:hypothetical protein